jgi:hypothetical protein
MAWTVEHKGLSYLVSSLIKKEFVKENLELILSWCLKLNRLMDKVMKNII